MRILARIGLALTSLMTPVVALAVPPDLVTGMNATLKDGTIVVTWAPVTGDSIKGYNVYYSHASILKNNGAYDDFVSVESTKTSTVIDRIPPVEKLYISVLAVNDAQEESAAFGEETMVILGKATTAPTADDAPTSATASSVSSTASSIVSNKTSEPATLKLLSAEAVSATGIQLRFSHAVTIDTAKAMTTFALSSGSGKVLPVTRISVLGNTVLLSTLRQERGAVYIVRIGEGVTSGNANGSVLSLDASQAPMLFTGHPTGIEPSSSLPNSSSSSASPLTEVASLALTKTSEQKGLSSVAASWKFTTNDGVEGLSVAQSFNGSPFSPPALMSAAVNRLTIPQVPAGTLTLLVRVRMKDGRVSDGAKATITIPKTVPHTDGTSSHLPSSGAGAFLAILLAGAGTGYRVMQKRALAKA